MPQLGESVTEGTILRWLKSEGEEVAADEPLCEVETDKVTAELPSPFAGTLREYLVEEGATVDVGAEIALLQTSDTAQTEEPEPQTAQGQQTVSTETTSVTGTQTKPLAQNGDTTVSATRAPEPDAASGGNGEQSAAALRRQRSSPVVRRLAAEHGVGISEVSGTGLDGRVTRKDIEAHAERLRRAPAEEAPERQARTERPELKGDVEVHEGDEILELTATRRAIANRMSLAKREAPHAWTMVEADVTGLAALREREKAGFERREGIKLTYLPFVVRAVAESLAEHPVLNSVWDGERIVLRKKINLGVAVDVEEGLVVPVIPDADGLSLTGLARAVDERIGRARSGSLRPEDVSGGTFTVNNPGALGSVVSTPIINHPQAAILSAEAVVKRPVVIEGDAIAVRSMMNLEVSFDHRILDGGAALGFLNAVKRRLEMLSPDDGLS
jgi:2-oxoisovalerate dehydrogenase E2 component (dihydrolipoyl transacylase)